MKRKILWSIFSALVLSIGASAATPTPTPTATPKPKAKSTPAPAPKRPLFSWTAPDKSGKPKPSPSNSRAKTTAKPSASPKSTPGPAKIDKKQTTSSPSPPASVAKEKSSSSPSPTTTPTLSPSASPDTESHPTETPSPAEQKSIAPGRSVEITLTKFEPMQGSPGEANYRNARLSYRITAGSAKVNFPAIDFSVESGSQKVLERHFAPPPGTDALEPGQSIERTISLDPSPDADSSAHGKIDKAKFTWSIDAQSNGAVEMPLNKSWP